MRCRVCGESELRFIWHGRDGALWMRCLACGSDSSTDTYEEIRPRYNAEYIGRNLRMCGDDRQALIRTMESNLDWFGKFNVPAKTFLDIGCNEGCGMEGMRDRGWIAAGFDVNPCAAGQGVVIADMLNASLFGSQFGAVMSREVIEHIDTWQDMLDQATALVLPGGLLQVQTPRPCSAVDDLPYCHDHLQLFSPFTLKTEIERRGFVILERVFWSSGQKWMAKKT